MQINNLTPGAAAAAESSNSRDDAMLQKVAEQFEELMLRTLLKSMRSTVPEGGLFDSDSMGAYQEMQDVELAKSLANKRSLGIAELVVRQLGGDSAGLQKPPPITAAESAYRSRPIAAPDPRASDSGKQGFIRNTWELAREFASKLNRSPEVLIAQAALETGWGKHLPTQLDGKSSHNLFGIKATIGWSGPGIQTTTQEYHGSEARTETALFRAYASQRDSFADYTRLINSSQRYQPAVKAETDAEYLRAIQDGGYATDPEYANKVRRIMHDPEFIQETELLRTSNVPPALRFHSRLAPRIK